MPKYKKRTAETLRLLKWANKYPGWWHLICTPNEEHMNLQMMKMLIEELAKESFYEIILVLLTVHKNEEFMKGFGDSMTLQILTANWNKIHKEDVIKRLINYFN